MNYYPHHIGDFNNATRHLTRVERSLYRDMIELYYDTEQPLLRDVTALCRRLIAKTEEESTAVEQVLNEFFTETEQGWFHERCDEEIRKYHGNISNKSAAGKASAEARAALKAASNQGVATDVEQVLDSRSTNQEPRTKTKNQNQEPIKSKATPDGDLFAGIDSQVVTDFKVMRSKQKAAITKTVIIGIQREADKAGVSLEDALRLCCERGWRGFKAEWIVGQARASPQPIDLAAAQKAANDEAKRRLFGSDEGKTINA